MDEQKNSIAEETVTVGIGAVVEVRKEVPPFPKLSALLRAVFCTYRNKFGVIVLSALFIIVPSMLLTVLFPFPDSGMSLIAVYYFLQVFLFFALILYFPVTLVAFRDDEGLWKSFRYVLSRACDIFRTWILPIGIFYSAIVLVLILAFLGYTSLGIEDFTYEKLSLFFILTPLLVLFLAVVASLFSSTALFAAIFEDKYGFSALERAGNLIRGKKWILFKKVFGFFLVTFIALVLYAILYSAIALLVPSKFTESIAILLSVYLVWSPWLFIFFIELYRSLIANYDTVMAEERVISGRKKVVFSILAAPGILLFALLLIYSIVGIFVIDEPAPNDSDLLLSKVNVPDSDNGYFDIAKAIEAASSTGAQQNEKIGDSLKIISGEEWNSEYAQLLVASTSELVALFNVAAEKSKYQNPSYDDPANFSLIAPMYSLNTARFLARVASVRAVLLHKERKDQEALLQGYLVAKLGTNMVNSQSFLIEYLVGIAVRDAGLTVLRTAGSGAASPETLLSYEKKINEIPNISVGNSRVMRSEYLSNVSGLNIINKVYYGGKTTKEEMELVGELGYSRTLFPRVLYLPNQTKRFAAEDARGNVKMMESPCSTFTDSKESLRERTPVALVGFMTPNIFGMMMTDIGSAGLNSVKWKSCDSVLSLNATRIVLALRAYENKNGKLPASLTELSSLGFEAPLDPYSGKPFIYDPALGIIASVGHNHKDDGRANGDEKILMNMKDPIFSVK
jgi:hypothetical protein